MKRKILFIVSLLAFAGLMAPATAKAEVPYETYSYNYYSETVAQPHVYLYEETYTFDGFETPLKNPQDMFIKGDDIYIADTDNSRIVKTNAAGDLIFEIYTAEDEGDPLSKPQGIFVTEEDHIYVADSGNGRLVEYDENGKYLRQIGRPVTDLIDPSVTYTPQKVVVDRDGRIYVTAYGINMGLIEFNIDGDFQSCMGAAQV